MAWTRSELGDLTRELSHREYVMQLFGGTFRDQNVEDYFIHGAAVLEAPILCSTKQLTSQLQRAWQHLRFEHPGIAIELSPDGREAVYEPCTRESERVSWLANSFCVNNSALSPNEVYGALQAKKSSYLCFAPNAGAIILCVQHWRGDGRGVLYLLGRLLTIISEGPEDPASLQWGAEEKRLPLSIDSLAGLDHNAASDNKGEAREAARAYLMMDSVKGIKTPKSLSAKHQASQLEVLTISASKSEAIIRSCKQLGLSVTSIFHAAACLQNIKQGVGGFDKPYVANVRRDIRKFLGAPASLIKNSADINASTSSFVKIDPCLDLLDFARALQKHYTDGFTQTYFRKFDAAFCFEVLQLALSGELTGLNPALETQFSSLGKLDNLIPSTFQISGGETVRVRSVEHGLTVYSPGVTGMWLYFFDRQIYMSITYNTAYQVSDAMLGFLSALEDAVVRGLAIDMDD